MPSKTKNGKAPPKRGGGRRIWLLAAVVVVVAVGAAVVVALVVDNGSSKPAATSALTTAHQYFAPECAPVQGAKWIYPGPAKIASSAYESFSIHYPCAQASAWTKRLAVLPVHVTKVGNPGKIKGPAGFVCEAWPDQNGHAYAGGCQKGPQTAFGWNWNVANSRQVLVHDESGAYHMEQLAGTDTETILRTLPNGHHQVEVLNTSGIGYLNSFAWTPPNGWKITALKAAKGARCVLNASAQMVTCTGKVPPPGCLCLGNGGNVKIDLAMKVPSPTTVKGAPEHFGTVGAKLKITRMTPVPYLIPGTQAEFKRQRGL